MYLSFSKAAHLSGNVLADDPMTTTILVCVNVLVNFGFSVDFALMLFPLFPVFVSMKFVSALFSAVHYDVPSNHYNTRIVQ